MDGGQAIVCVDDEVIILLSLKQELTRYFNGRFRTEIAVSAEEALVLIERLYSEDVRVILMLTDWLMPGIKGDQLISLVKQKHPDVRCIMISGQVDTSAVEAAKLNPLLDAFIKKPWRSGQLIESILRCVDR
jgi:DNA-binding NtrC family response regulator